MPDVTTEFTRETTKETAKDIAKESNPKSGQMPVEGQSAASESKRLDQRYGEIGISAVAAAVLYQGRAKNPA